MARTVHLGHLGDWPLWLVVLVCVVVALLLAALAYCLCLYLCRYEGGACPADEEKAGSDHGHGHGDHSGFCCVCFGGPGNGCCDGGGDDRCDQCLGALVDDDDEED